MRFALDKDGVRIYIEQTLPNEEYFCPQCRKKLIQKKGQIRVHHFAHPSHSECTDSWHYDMSEWHMRWQDRFPFETQEIVKTKDGKTHRADVLLEDEKLVYEFQHSPMTAEEFADRNNFYNSLGYKVIWIFDLCDQFENGAIDGYKMNRYSWKRAKKTFKGFVPQNNPMIELYFQTQVSGEENEQIAQMKASLEAGHDIFSDKEKSYYYDHVNDEIELIKVVWAPADGFEHFGTDGYFYGESDVVSFAKSDAQDKDEPTIRLADLTDHLIEMRFKGHTTYYFGCPRTTTHICADTNIDIPKDKYDEIYPCVECDFSVVDNPGRPMCKKRFIDLNLSGSTQVKVVDKNADGFISRLSYQDEAGIHIIDLPTYTNPWVDSIYELWRKGHYEIAIFKNMRTGVFVKLTKDPIQQKQKYGKVWGYFSYDQRSFNEKSVVIYGCEKSEWACVLSRRGNSRFGPDAW